VSIQELVWSLEKSCPWHNCFWIVRSMT
jgi:hypothetical protein